MGEHVGLNAAVVRRSARPEISHLGRAGGERGKLSQERHRKGERADELDGIRVYLNQLASTSNWGFPDFESKGRGFKSLRARSFYPKKIHMSLEAFPLRLVEEELRRIPSKGWAEIIRKVYDVDPLLCPSCVGRMKVISFIEDPKAIDKIICHLNLSFQAERPPPSPVIQQELLMAAEGSGEYF